MAEIMIGLGISKVWKRKDSSMGYSESTKLRHPGMCLGWVRVPLSSRWSLPSNAGSS